MKKYLAYSLGSILLIGSLIFISNSFKEEPIDKMAELRKQHEFYLKNNPFIETLKLSKKERKKKGIPPNKYFEQEWVLSMNPYTGQSEPEKVFKLQEQLRLKRTFSKVPGEKNNDWVERGPNNIGGRTRAIMFDPNDNTNKRVFAAGVSGGLWVNDDITSFLSFWSEVNIPQNLAITCIAYDPNNTNHFYVGTGEATAGRVVGNGVWRSTDAGANWSRVFGGVSGETTFITDGEVTVNSPGNIAGDYGAFTAAFGPGLTTVSGDLVLVDDGTSAPDEGCNALVNGASISGKIALVRRGSCNFTAKVKNAQDQGAIAAVIINNVAGPPIVPGGEDATVTIPSVMISKDDGEKIVAQLGSTVNVTLSTVSASGIGNYGTPGINFINDIKIRDLGSGNSEIYVASGSWADFEGNPVNIFGINDYGLHKSINSGSSWSKVNLPLTADGSDYEIMDIEFSKDNNIWLASKGNIFGHGGGTILSSSDGVTYTVRKEITNGDRTEIAVSSLVEDKVYALAQVVTENAQETELIAPFLYMASTDDAFVTETAMGLPGDADSGIAANDFTRGQAFYDLEIEVDPTNDNILYAGGIDLFRSADAGANWDQITKWSNNNNLAALNVPLVHADHHAFVFHPTDPTIALVGTDGGVDYAINLNSSPPTILPRKTNYNTVQFYNGAIGQEVGNEKLLGGSQDNGTLYEESASGGLNSFDDINNGGDGTYVFIDRGNEYVIASFVYNVYTRRSYADGSFEYDIDSDQSSGQFVNPAALDSDNNYLYSNGTNNNDGFQINRYRLLANSATKTALTDALLDGSPTAFKASTFTAATTTLFVGTDNGKLFRITNAQSQFLNSWTDITGDDFFGSISCIELGTTENDIYVTFHNYGVTNVFYSADGGLTWQNKEGNLPDIPVKAIMPNPLNANEVILGTELGVWGTADFSVASPNWVQAQNGMKDVKVTSFDLRTADNTVLATTYGRGMFTGQFTAAPSTLSISENTIQDLIKVYPTVSNGNFKIKVNENISKAVLNVYNINGQKVYNSKLDFSRGNIQDVSLNSASGLYILELSSNDLKMTKKIIIN